LGEHRKRGSEDKRSQEHDPDALKVESKRTVAVKKKKAPAFGNSQRSRRGKTASGKSPTLGVCEKGGGASTVEF